MNNQTYFSRSWFKAVVLSLLAAGLSGPRLLGDDFTASTTFDGVTTNTANIHVGLGFSDILITITNGAQVINTGRVNLGYASPPSSNTAILVTGSTSLLTNTAQVTVGRLAASNTLAIVDGGRVFSVGGFIGGQDGDDGPAGSNNVAIVSGTGSIWNNNSGVLTVGKRSINNQLIVTNGGLVVSDAGVIGGDVNPTYSANAAQNTVIITGTGSVWTNTTGALYEGIRAGSEGSYNRLIVSAGGRAFGEFGLLGVAATSSNNTMEVNGTGSLLRFNSEIEVGYAGTGNQVTITNGGQLVVGVNANIGLLGSASNNSVVVTGAGSVWTNGLNLAVGRSSRGNQLTIEDGGRVESVNGWLGGRDGDASDAAASNNTVLVTGPGSVWNNTGVVRLGGNTVGNSGNQLIITNGGLVTAGGLVNVGIASSGVNNSLRVVDDGVLETAAGLSTGGAAGNTISNIGGVFQFTTVSPSISPAAAGRIAVTDGVIAYRNVATANIYNSQVSNIVFAGDNTFRLNSASNTTASQTYNFTTALGPTNFARLEMINGDTAYRGGDITIGGGGSMLVSNTRATITGILTNLGAFSSVNAQATFQSAVYNNGTWATDPTTNTFASSYTVGTLGSITMTAGDVMIFNNDFINTSTQSNTYNTLDGKFLFNGVATTQRFYTAGHELGQAPTSPINTNRLAGNEIGFTNNFALGTFEIANFSTVRVSDAFSLLGPGTNDNLRAALYVDNLFMFANSFLIVDTNVTVYFKNSNDWSNANFALLGDGELHQLFIPEPSVLLLLTMAAVIVRHARRR